MIAQTSMLAYFENVKPSLNKKQKLVLEALEEIQPANNKQIAEHLGWPINCVTGRCLELRKKQQVTIAYIAKDLTGRKCTFWKPVDAEGWTE